jgi:hypothetical protein
MYGFGESHAPNSSFASSFETEPATAVPLDAADAVGPADERGRVRLQVADVDVGGRVTVVGTEVRSYRVEDDEAAVAGHPGHLRVAVALCPRGGACRCARARDQEALTNS